MNIYYGVYILTCIFGIFNYTYIYFNVLGNPPAKPGDQQSLTYAEVGTSLLIVSSSVRARGGLSVKRNFSLRHTVWDCKYHVVWIQGKIMIKSISHKARFLNQIKGKGWIYQGTPGDGLYGLLILFIGSKDIQAHLAQCGKIGGKVIFAGTVIIFIIITSRT